MIPLIIIVGPTAVGKTELGIRIAKQLNGEIISGDSVQVYRHLNIGSAKPTVEERQGIPHFLIDELDLDEPFTVALFREYAQRYIREIRERNHIPIVVGGTGLYIRSLLDPFEFCQSGSEQIRQKWDAFLKVHGKVALHNALKERDPVTAAKLHPHDTVRIIRALEIYELTGKPKSEQVPDHNKIYPPLDPSILYLGLHAPREALYERINKRCVKMIDQGLIEETAKILQSGYSPHLKPLQSIGYRHAIWYLHGKVTHDEMLRLLQRDTRRFAKRQLTWFKRDPRIRWFDITAQSLEEIVMEVVATCRGLQSRVE